LRHNFNGLAGLDDDIQSIFVRKIDNMRLDNRSGNRADVTVFFASAGRIGMAPIFCQSLDMIADIIDFQVGFHFNQNVNATVLQQQVDFADIAGVRFPEFLFVGKA